MTIEKELFQKRKCEGEGLTNVHVGKNIQNFTCFRALYSALLYTYTEVYDNSLFPDYFPTFFVTIPTTFYIYPTKSNIRKRHRCESIYLLVPVRSRKMFIFSFCFC